MQMVSSFMGRISKPHGTTIHAHGNGYINGRVVDDVAHETCGSYHRMGQVPWVLLQHRENK